MVYVKKILLEVLNLENYKLQYVQKRYIRNFETNAGANI